MDFIKNNLLFFAERPEMHDNLIGKLYGLKDMFIMRLKDLCIDQMRSFIINHRNCIILFFIENSKDSAMSLLYKICNCTFSLPYIIVVFKNSTYRLVNHVRVHDSFKIFCMDSKDYTDDLVIDWIKKVCVGLSFSVVFPRLKSYMLSSTRFKITTNLKKLGMFSYLTGYKYVVDAIELYVNDSSLCITKDIYRILADKYKTNSMNIDRCMRHAIEAVWRDSKLENLKKYYLNDDKIGENKPSVFEFIRCMAEKFSLQNNNINCNTKIS